MHASDLPIEEPCGADFSTMTGDERRRFCGQCNLHVHDLSAMTESEAEEVLEDPEVCVRYQTDSRGQIFFSVPRAAAVALALAATPAFAGGQAAEPDTGWVDWFWSLFESDEDGPSKTESAPEEGPAPIPVHQPVSEDDEPERRPIRMGRPARRQPPAQSGPTVP